MIGGTAHQLERFAMLMYGDRTYGNLPKQGHGLSALVLARARRQSRYFACGNVVRLAILIPVLYALRHGPMYGLGMAIYLSSFHLFLAIVETYRYQVLMRLIPEEPTEVIEEEQPPKPEFHWYYGPYLWENEKLYRVLGAEVARKTWEKFVAWARGDRDTVYGPVEPEQVMSRRVVHQFLWNTRQSELTHLIGLATDLPPMIALFTLRSTAMIPLGVSIWVDAGIIVLQRQHRSRLRRFFRERDKH